MSSPIERKETNFPCKDCHRSYVYSRDLARHRRKVHGDEYIKTPKSKPSELKKSWRCKICDKQYINFWFLKNHVKIIHKKMNNIKVTKIKSIKWKYLDSNEDSKMDKMVEKMVQMHQKIRKSEVPKIEEEKKDDKLHSIVEKMVQMNKKKTLLKMKIRISGTYPEVIKSSINGCMLCKEMDKMDEKMVQMRQKMVRMHQTMVDQI